MTTEFIIDHHGAKVWKVNGMRHRVNGPAIEWPNGVKSWYLNDKWYSFNRYCQKLYGKGWRQAQTFILLKLQ